MKVNFLILTPLLFGVIVGDYVGPQNGRNGNGNGHGNGNGNGHGNGNGNGHGNGNGNSYGVPPDSITPPQPQGGPYPPSGWKPAGRRLLLPGESRSAQQPVDSSYGQPPPPQYGPANPSPSGPSIDSQYGPSVDNTGPPNNQYIPGTGFGNGNGNGNGHSNGSGNGNGNGNGHSNGNGNGNGHSNGSGNGNGHSNGSGNNNGNGHGNGNGQNGVTGFGNGNGNGQNGGNGFSNGNGNGKAEGTNGFAPAFHNAFPGGVIYPFVQHSVPAVLAFRPNNGANHGSVYPIYQVPHPGNNVITSSFPTGHGVFPLVSAGPTYQTTGVPYPGFEIANTHNLASSYPAVVGHHKGLLGHGTEHYTFLSNHQSQKSNILGVSNGLTNLQLQYTVGNSAYGSEGVPLGLF